MLGTMKFIHDQLSLPENQQNGEKLMPTKGLRAGGDPACVC